MSSSKIEHLLEVGYRALVILFILLGAPFVFWYESEGTPSGGWSSRYILGVIVPFAGVAAAAILAGLPAGKAFLASLGGIVPRRAGTIAAGLGVLTGAAYGFWIADEHVSTLMAILVPSLVVMIWVGVSRDVSPLLPFLILLVFGVLLFATEAPRFLSHGPMAVWGHREIFPDLFPRRFPFIGHGGRLRPNLDVAMAAPEYKDGARLVTNSAGFRNREEFSLEPDGREFRILSLGDSFSTGFCSDQEAFFGSLLQKSLTVPKGQRAPSVMNAEVSDPAYGLYYLQNFGVGYRPDVVLYGLSGNDIMQAAQFYGEDRFFRLDGAGRLIPNPGIDPRADSIVERYREFAYPVAGNPGYWPLAPVTGLIRRLVSFRLFSGIAVRAAGSATSVVAMPSYFAEEIERSDNRKRMIDGSANLGFFYKGEHEPVEKMYAAFFDLLLAMDRSAKEGGARFILMLHPERYQVQPADWEALMTRWRMDEADFDLRLANTRIAGFCERHGIALCDLVGDFAEAAPRGQLYLPGGDMHYNRAGNEVAAAAASRCLSGMIPR